MSAADVVAAERSELADLMLRLGPDEPTLCEGWTTRDLAAHVRSADIVVAAAGVPGLITADLVKPGAAVLVVGVSRMDGKIAGDVAKDVVEVAGHVAPNPGGVGPMTRAMLLSNVVEAAERAAR